MKIFITYIICISVLLTSSYSKDIRLGMSADFSASISYLGLNMEKGILSYFHKINKNSKHKFKLTSYDDKYNPVLASANVKKLIEYDEVLALIGNVGTPTANVILPIINEHKIPFFGAYSGGLVLRETKNNTYVFNYRASYSQEAFTIVSNLLNKGVNPKDIAVFSQNDTYGDSGFFGVTKAFREFGINSIYDIAHERYTNGTVNVETGLSKLLDWENDFKAIVVVGVNKATVKFIKYAKEDFPNAKFFVLSPVNLEIVSTELNEFKDDIYATQVVPSLSEDSTSIALDYKKDFKNLYPNEDFNLISFEGYIVAKLFVESLKGLDFETLTSEDIYKKLKEVDLLDIGLGFKSNFKNNVHQYCNQVWLTKFDKSNKLININWEDILKK